MKPKKHESSSSSLLKQPKLTFPSGSSGGGSSGGGSSSRHAGGLRQATIQSLAGVVDYSASASELDVPSTLYLGEEEVERLKARLEAADGPEEQMPILTRLSAMPCTRQLLEKTKIGVTVGHMRKSADPEVAKLCERLVKVWKGQLQEHRSQNALRATKPAHLPPPHQRLGWGGSSSGASGRSGWGNARR